MNDENDMNPSTSAELADQGYSAAGEVGLLKARRSLRENIWRGLKTAPPTAIFGLVVVSIYVFFAIFARLLAPHGEAEIFDIAYAPWGGEFLFGTDQLGRDVLSRLIYGAQNTVGIAFVTTMLAFFIGGSLGIAAAINNNNWVDNLLSRSVDVLMAIPGLIFALILLSMFGATTINLILIIAVLDSTRVYRVARAACAAGDGYCAAEGGRRHSPGDLRAGMPVREERQDPGATFIPVQDRQESGIGSRQTGRSSFGLQCRRNS